MILSLLGDNGFNGQLGYIDTDGMEIGRTDNMASGNTGFANTLYEGE